MTLGTLGISVNLSMQAMLVEKCREKARSEVACAPAADNFKIWACKQISQMARSR